MSRRYAIDARGPDFERLDGVGVVFHGINKSGSLAMAKVIGEAMARAGRGGDFLCHYTLAETPLDRFRDMVEAQRGRGFAVGHSLYGSIRPAPNRIWVTQFRHPLPRVVSVHQWLRREHERQHGSPEGFPDLARFVRAGGGGRHSQVAQLARNHRRAGLRRVPRGLSPREMFELSCAAIEREFAWIGIAERFEESIYGFAALCGLPSVAPWERDLRNPGRPLVTEIDPATQDLIREAYADDFALYDWALARFEAQLARVEFGPSLAAYKAACEGEYRDRILPGADGAPPQVTLGRPEATSGRVRDLVPARLAGGIARLGRAGRRLLG